MNLKRLLAASLSTLFVVVFLWGKPAFASEYPPSGLEPVYATGPDDTNHVSEVPENLREFVTTQGKTIVFQASDGRWVDATRTFLKAREIFIEKYNATTDERERASMKLVLDQFYNRVDQSISRTEDSYSRITFMLIEHPSTHTFDFFDPAGLEAISEYSIFDGDIVHSFYKFNAHTMNPSNLSGVDLRQQFMVLAYSKSEDTWPVPTHFTPLPDDLPIVIKLDDNEPTEVLGKTLLRACTILPYGPQKIPPSIKIT